MNIADIIAPERISVAAEVPSKKRALEYLAGLLAEGTPYLATSDIFSGLTSREKLGSTGIGDGVAIPHARMKATDECVGAFVRLPQPVAFDASDEQPVDLMFGLLVPEQSTEEHLQLLRSLAEMFSETECVAALRKATNANALFDDLNKHIPAAPTEAG